MVPDYGKVWYDDKSIANMFSLVSLVYRYSVIYDLHKDDDFNVHTNRGIIKFKINKQSLFVFNLTYHTANSNTVTTVKVNLVVFTSRQRERAKLSSKI